jgi:membrane carboxypeptidase/penicillin-binding protein
MGYPRGEIPMTNVHGQEVAGATFPVPMWHLYMDQAERGLPARQFLTPKTYPSFEPFTRGYWGYLAVQTYAPAPATTSQTTVSTAQVTTADHPAPVPSQRGIH